MWKTKFTSQTLFIGLLFSRNAKKLTKVYYKLFYSVCKETSHKPLKVAAAKESFSSVYIIDTSSFDESFLFHVITGNIIFCRNLWLPRGMVQMPCCCVL